MNVLIQVKTFFSDTSKVGANMDYASAVFQYIPDNKVPEVMEQLAKEKINIDRKLIAIFRSYTDYGVLSHYLVEEEYLENTITSMKRVLELGTVEPFIKFEVNVINEFDLSSIITDPKNFVVEIIDPAKIEI
jgi:hypothetical protein